MTASMTSERPGKRDRLVAGAREAIYRQGFEAPTIAATRDPAVRRANGTLGSDHPPDLHRGFYTNERRAVGDRWRFAPVEGPLDGEELR
jgi:hypothetical protein